MSSHSLAGVVGTRLAVFITFPLPVSYCSMAPLLRLRASGLRLFIPAHSPLLMFAFTMLACLFLRHPSPFTILPHFWACCRTVYQYHILVIIATHSSPLANCALVFPLANVSRGVSAIAAAVSTLYLLPVLSTYKSLLPPSPLLFFPPTFLPSMWSRRYLGLVYVVGFARESPPFSLHWSFC